VAAYRDRADGGVDVYAHRVKSLLLVTGLVVFTVLGLVIVLVEPREWSGWACLVFFGGIGSLYVRRSLRTGVLTGKPALILNPEGLHDRSSGLRVTWDEVREIEYREMHTRGGTQRFLGLWVHDVDAVRARLPRVLRAIGRIQLPGWPPFSVALNLLGTTTDETVGLVRRFYDGPIHYDGEIDPTPERPPRSRRFLRWAREAAITAAIGIAIAAVLIWLDV
jgi:hypothetical protein